MTAVAGEARADERANGTRMSNNALYFNISLRGFHGTAMVFRGTTMALPWTSTGHSNAMPWGFMAMPWAFMMLS